MRILGSQSIRIRAALRRIARFCRESFSHGQSESLSRAPHTRARYVHLIGESAPCVKCLLVVP